MSIAAVRLIGDRFPQKFLAPPMIMVPWSEEAEAAEGAAGDIDICRIPDDVWKRGKCLGRGTAMLCRSPADDCPVAVHTLLFQHGITGYLVETDEEWIAAVERLPDRELRRRMGRAAREFVEPHSSVDALSDRFRDLVVGPRSPMAQKGSTAA